MKTEEMTYNKVNLLFPKSIEKLFRQIYFKNSIVQLRVALILVIFLYAIFGWLDVIMFPDYVSIFFKIRYSIVIPVIGFVFLLSFARWFDKIWQPLLLICFIVGGAGISVMTMFDPENYAYYAGMMLIFFSGYLFIKLRFYWATIGGWTTLIVWDFIAIYYAHVSSAVLWSNNFFFVSANLIGMFAAYHVEYQIRHNFFLNQKLDEEKLFAEDLNKNLEKTVNERTKELVKAKNAAEKSDRLKSAFLANMSHEIRTPMNGILGFSELLKEPDLNTDRQAEYINIIEKSGRRMLCIIDDIINISKVESGLMEVDIEDTSVNEQMQDIMSFFGREAESKGLQLLMDDHEISRDVVIKTDREKLYAILANLVKNSIKYTNRGTIEIGFRINYANVEFFVKDTGLGIKKDRQKAIFERFMQADNSNRMTQQGAGLGLAITQAYLGMLNGRIWVESEEGKGSTFYFTLPLDHASSIESKQ